MLYFDIEIWSFSAGCNLYTLKTRSRTYQYISNTCHTLFLKRYMNARITVKSSHIKKSKIMLRIFITNLSRLHERFNLVLQKNFIQAIKRTNNEIHF